VQGSVFQVYTIGQFSKICKVTAKALRHYERLGLLAPARIGPDNQYRYYTAEQVALLKQIAFMKELGLPLKVIKRLIDRREGPEQAAALLEEHRNRLLRQVDICNSRLNKLAWWKKAQEVQAMSENTYYHVHIREVQEAAARSRRKVMTGFPEELPVLLRSLLEEAGDACSGPPIMIYHDEEFNPARVDVEAAWPVSDPAVATGTLPSCRAAAVMHVGPYDQLCQAYEAVFAWINGNGYRTAGPLREINYNDPAVTPPEKLVTEVLVPVVKP
jgi:DNA-binding transcriptional MerR regulator